MSTWANSKSRDATLPSSFAAVALRRVEFGARNRDKVPDVPVEGFAARDQHLSIRQHGHGFSKA
jgi:hypothetical protein